MNYEQILARVVKAPIQFATKRGQWVSISADLAVTVTDDSGTYELLTAEATPEAVAAELFKQL